MRPTPLPRPPPNRQPAVAAAPILLPQMVDLVAEALQLELAILEDIIQLKDMLEELIVVELVEVAEQHNKVKMGKEQIQLVVQEEMEQEELRILII